MLSTLVPSMDVVEEIDPKSARSRPLVEKTGEVGFEGFPAAHEEGVEVPPLRCSAAGFRPAGDAIPLEEDNLVIVIGQDPRSGETRYAAADDDCAPSSGHRL
jgi:hypothetical protein